MPNFMNSLSVGTYHHHTHHFCFHPQAVIEHIYIQVPSSTESNHLFRNFFGPQSWPKNFVVLSVHRIVSHFDSSRGFQPLLTVLWFLQYCVRFECCSVARWFYMTLICYSRLCDRLGNQFHSQWRYYVFDSHFCGIGCKKSPSGEHTPFEDFSRRYQFHWFSRFEWQGKIILEFYVFDRFIGMRCCHTSK